MSSLYPGQIDTFVDPQSTDPGTSPSRSATVRKLNSAAHAVEQTLGVNPQGAFADVATRFANLPTGGGGAAGSGNDPTWLTLNGAVSVGASSVIVNESPTLFAAHDNVVTLDPYTTNAETIAITGVTGGGHTITLGTTVKLPHANGTAVLINAPFDAAVYGADGNVNDTTTATKNSRAYQRMLLERGSLGYPANYHRVKYPLAFTFTKGGALFWIGAEFDDNCIQTNIADNTGFTRNALLTMCRQNTSFTVTAGTNFIVYGPEDSGFNSLDNSSSIQFSEPYAAGSLPPEIKWGRKYKIMSLDSVNKRIQISDYNAPATIISFSGNGSGWAHGNMASTQKLFIDGTRIFCEKAGAIDGIHMNPEQQTDVTNLRTDWDNGAVAGTGIGINGQWGHFTNPESNMHSALQNAVTLLGTGWFIDFMTINGPSPGIDVTGQNVVIGHLLLESVVGYGLRLGNTTKAFKLVQGYFSTPSGSNVPFMSIDQNCSADIGPIQTVDSGVHIIDFVGFPAYSFNSGDGVVWSGVGDTDGNGVFPGIVLHKYSPPHFKNRFDMGEWSAAGSSPMKMRRIYHSAYCRTDTQNGEIWLSANPFDGLDHIVGKGTTSNNLLTIKDGAGTTLDTTLSAGVNKVQCWRFNGARNAWAKVWEA